MVSPAHWSRFWIAKAVWLCSQRSYQRSRWKMTCPQKNVAWWNSLETDMQSVSASATASVPKFIREAGQRHTLRAAARDDGEKIVEFAVHIFQRQLLDRIQPLAQLRLRHELLDRLVQRFCVHARASFAKNA